MIIHPSSEIQSQKIGKNSRIWQNVVILERAAIGVEANICANCFIENDVVIGDRVTLKCGVYLWDGTRIGNDVFIGPNATFCNDKFPRSKNHDRPFENIIIEDGASIGAGAVLLPGITIGKCAMVGAGAVVTTTVPPYAIVKGNPAQITDYICTAESIQHNTSQIVSGKNISVRDVALFSLKHVQDIRGEISIGDFCNDIPFDVERFFIVYNVPNKKIRGEHAHYQCKQFLICVHGYCSIVVDDGKVRQEILLDNKNIGIYIPNMIWSIQYKFSSDAVLLVFASNKYDNGDYIRDYKKFSDLVSS